MSQGAYIFGCEGTTLATRERDFFREAEPWGFILFARNVCDPSQLLALTRDLREAVGRDAPILIDQEGGRVQRLRAPYWREFQPPMDQIEAAGDMAERSMWLRGRLIAADLKSVGIDVNCAPTLDVAGPETHPFLRNRCYGETPERVIRMGKAITDGMAGGGVAAVMKHMPGHGRASVDSHLGLPRISVSQAEFARDLEPFRAMSYLAMGMTAHIILDFIDPETPATQSAQAIQLIRRQIGFDGLLMTDDISMGALTGSMTERCENSLRAGCDLILHCNGDFDEMQEVARLGRMSDEAQERADVSAASRETAQPIDIEALDAELHSLLPITAD